MRRLFISLYAALALTVVVCAVVVPWLFERSLERPLARYGEQLAAAPQFLFEQELARHPPEQWPQVIRELQGRFGYELTLQPLEALDVDAATRDRLRTGQALVPIGPEDQSEAMLLPIRGSGFVVTTRFSESEFESAQRAFGGIYALIERHLDTLPASQRSSTLQDLTRRFGVPLTLVPLEATDLDAARRQRIARGEVVGLGLDVDSEDERYYKLLPDGSAVLKIGPLPGPSFVSYVMPLLFGALAAVLALVTFVWVRPLWHDMRQLEQGAQTLGSGALEARVDVASRSALRPLADTFNAMADRIQSLVTRQRHLTNAVSHELRTPLARLRFALDMLGRAPTESDRARHVASMATDIAELEALVAESLEYARLDAEADAPLAIEDVPLEPWLEGVVAANRDLVGNLEVSITVEPGGRSGRFDRRLMTRALQNLVRNALQHARHRVALRVTGSKIEVEDDGPGVPVAQSETIFLPFHRTDESRSRNTGGHGLGLAIARRIVELHRATLVADQSTMGGACFRIEGGSVLS